MRDISFFQRVKEIIYFKPPRGEGDFEIGSYSGGEGEEDKDNLSQSGEGEDDELSNENSKKKRGRVRPRQLRFNSGRESKDRLSPEESGVVDTGNLKISGDLDADIDYLKRVFNASLNSDLVFRELSIGINPPVRAVIIYIDGMTDKAVQNDSVLQPLMLLSRLRWDIKKDARYEVVQERLLPGNQVADFEEMRDVINGVLMGDTAVVIDGAEKALVVETKGWEHRSVEKPGEEMVVRGPHESFTETYRVNTALVRKGFQSPDLITESFKVGKKDRVNCGLMYLKGVVNPALVKEAKRRIQSLETDYLGSSELMEQFIEDNSYALAPQVLSTERPDRVINYIMEGKVAVLVDGSPHVLVLPVNFFGLFQSAEDAYLRWPYGSLLRMVRALGIFLATFLPGIYIAVTVYHQEMIPTNLLMAIAGAREQVPFPTVVEVLIMEISFELIREAGIRIPGVVGPTLGIVGALILGQAAVAANIVSPILIVIVAVTAIGSFAIPNYSLTLSVRAMRFVYILLAAVLGIFGLVLGFFIHLTHLAGLKSFGVPFLSPFGTPGRTGADVFLRRPSWKQERRPAYIAPLRQRLQPHISRRWTRENRGGDTGDNGQ